MMNQLLKLIKRDPQSLREKEIRCEENALKKTKPVDLVENTLENNRNSAMNFNKDMNGINVLYTNY
ncbi:hypothetical protein HN682_03590, partial [Candidatus Peregrinibacteria bacterium]|nr:hypothetical protein [Candidatus Peregrinibacteria bacterium]